MKCPGRRLALGSAGALAACLALACCGGGGGSGGSSSTPPLAGNQIVVTVDDGPPGANALNSLYASVTVCAPGTSNCQTIDHVLVDTASSGLRILASAMSSRLIAALPRSTDGSGQAIVECAQFVDGYLWGPTQLADVRMGAETAGDAVIQIAAAPGSPPVPASCSGTGPALDSVAALGANGLLGVSTFAQDCGSGCVGVANTNNGLYYSCSGSACSPAPASLAQQLWNPVALFASDNNGFSISLPAVGTSEAQSLTGTMTFGIGTGTNNALPAISVLTVDPAAGDLGTIAGGTSYPGSYVDSGSNAYFFGSGLFPACTTFVGFYCPSGARGVSAVLQGVNGATAAGNFIVGNPEVLFALHPSVSADAEIAGPNGPPSNGFDWGLPFFFGITVYMAIENRATPAVDGPWIGIK
jgi:hypothetical protein